MTRLCLRRRLLNYENWKPYTTLEIKISDILGKEVYSQALTSAEDEIIVPFAKIKQGSYIISIVADGKTIQVERIVKK